MVIEEILAISSERRDLRNFGLVVGSGFLVLAGFLLWKDRPLGPLFALAGGVLILLGLAFPALLKPLQKAWMTLAVLMGWVMTRVILGILFFFVLTPIGLTARLFGQRFLDRGPGSGTDTYWRKRQPLPDEREMLEKQF